DERVAIHATSHHVPAEHVPAILVGKLICLVIDHARNGGRTMEVVHHGRNKTKAVMWLAKAGIIPSSDQLIDRFGVTIRREEIEQRVHRHAEWVDLTPCELFNSRTIESQAVSVSRLH